MVNITISNDPHLFCEKYQFFLAEKEVQNCLFLTLLERLKKNPRIFGTELRFFYIESENRIALAMQTVPHNIILGFPFPQDFIGDFIDFLEAKPIEFPGIFGEISVISSFADQYQQKTNLVLDVKVRERVFKLERVDKNVRMVPNTSLRQATISDSDLVISWMYKFNREASHMHGDQSLQEFTAEQKPVIEEAINNNEFYLLKNDQNTPLSMARSPGSMLNGKLVNYVYTPMEMRKKGYATAVVAKLSQTILNDGYKYCALFTDVSNPTSNSIYQKIGYRKVLDVNVVEKLCIRQN